MIGDVPVRSLTVELTHRCHRRCAFCYVGASAKTPPELPASELAQLTRSLAQATNCRRVQISGGEPLLRNDLLDFIDALGDIRASLLTDGAHLDPTMARALARRGVGPIQPTLLAGRAALHDELRGTGSFQDATRAIATASTAGLTVIVSMVVTAKNWAEAPAVAEIAFALGARKLALARFCPAGAARAAAAELTPSAAQIVAAANDAATACAELELGLTSVITIPRCVFPEQEPPPLPTGVCSLVGPATTVTVGPDGGVRSCAMSDQAVGFLAEEPWAELARRLWERQLQPLRRSPPEQCRDCRWLSRCLGGCRLSGLGAPGELDPLAVDADGE